MRLKILRKGQKLIRFSLAPTSIWAHACTKNHRTPRVSYTGILACIVYNKLGKHPLILNKIAETKIIKRQCQKTSNWGGGGGGGDIRLFPPKSFALVYNEKLPMVLAEIDASKSTALKWFA